MVMTKKASFILSLFSILSPVLLILLVILITLTENFFRTRYIEDPFFPFLIFWTFEGWIFGLCTGILGLVSSIRLKKDKINTSGISFICILGILFNSLWLIGIIYAWPAWMGI
jgi:hypothetical protein